jgi:hypothetical protein
LCMMLYYISISLYLWCCLAIITIWFSIYMEAKSIPWDKSFQINMKELFFKHSFEAPYWQ